jgi:hypothetical protein
MNTKGFLRAWILTTATILAFGLLICSNATAQRGGWGSPSWSGGGPGYFGYGNNWGGGYGNSCCGFGMFGRGSSSSSADVSVEEFLEDLADKFDLDFDDLLDELDIDPDDDLEEVDWDDLRDALSDFMSEKMDEERLNQFIDDMTDKLADYCADDNLDTFIGNLLDFIDDVDEDDLEDYHETTKDLLLDLDYSDCTALAEDIAVWSDDNWTDLGKVYIEYFTTESKAFYKAYMENLKNEMNSNIDLGTWYNWGPSDWSNYQNSAMGNMFGGMGGFGYGWPQMNYGGWGSPGYPQMNYGGWGGPGSPRMNYGGWGGPGYSNWGSPSRYAGWSNMGNGGYWGRYGGWGGYNWGAPWWSGEED